MSNMCSAEWYRRVWVDFNDVDSAGDVLTLQAFANQTLFIGDRVIAVDGDGIRCDGYVKSHDDTTLLIHLDGEVAA